MGSLEHARVLLQRRALVWVLTRRDLVARYRGTALGFLWTFAHPLLLLGVYAIVFGVFVRVEAENYPAFLCAGLLPWLWFAQSLALGTTSILGHAPFLKQAAFPAAVPPAVVVLSSALNFLFGLPVLLGILWALGSPPTRWLAFLPLVIAVQFGLGLGLALGLAPLAVHFRDTAQLVQALLTPLFFLTPVLYPPQLVPPEFAWLVELNPVAPLIASYQAVLLGQGPPPVALGLTAAVALAAFVAGGAILSALRERLPEEL